MKRKLLIPGWLFVPGMLIFCEALLHLWTCGTFLPERFAAVLCFALGFGSLLGLILSLLPAKAQKWTAVILAFLIVVLYLAEYFMIDAYKTFMSLSTMFTRAGDVAGDYGDTVVTVLSRNVPRILLVLAPVILFALFTRSRKATRRAKGWIAVTAVLGFSLGFNLVHFTKTDASKLNTAYPFNSAVHCFGLGLGITLDTVHTNAPEKAPTFQVAVTSPPATEAPAATGEVPAETEAPEIVYGDNAFPLDYAALAAEETDPNIASLHSYVASQKATKQNAYTGLFAGKNLILITAEAFTAEVIDPERTPTLYRMANQGIQFKEYYQPVWNGSTTTGEFTNVTGLVPLWTGMAMQEVRFQKMFLTMGNQLQALGYSSAAYHNGTYTYYNRNETHTHLGYDTFTAMYNGLEEGVTYQSPESDEELFEYTIPFHLDQQPFSLYYMTISGHASYWRGGNAMVDKNWHYVEDMEGSQQVKGYLAANMELELAMASLLRQLEEAGIADDTVVVIATDHYPYGLEPSDAWGNYENYLNELYGYEVKDCFDRDHSGLIIWSGCLEDSDPIVVDSPVYSLDILPTLSNLFGVEYDSRLLTGRDVFSEAQPLVLWPTHCWLTDKGSFDISTGVFTPREGVTVDEGYVERMKAEVANRITFSKAVQEYRYYTAILKALGRD